MHLAVGRHKALPRRYRGQDSYWWMDRLGMLSRAVDTLPGGRAPRGPNAVLAGGTRDLDVPALAREGVVVHGRLLGVTAGAGAFGGGLAATLAAAEPTPAVPRGRGRLRRGHRVTVPVEAPRLPPGRGGTARAGPGSAA